MPTGISPRSRKACHSISTALQQNISKIRTQSTMTIGRNTLDRFAVLAAADDASWIERAYFFSLLLSLLIFAYLVAKVFSVFLLLSAPSPLLFLATQFTN
jgi:hypothetical protein